MSENNREIIDDDELPEKPELADNKYLLKKLDLAAFELIKRMAKAAIPGDLKAAALSLEVVNKVAEGLARRRLQVAKETNTVTKVEFIVRPLCRICGKPITRSPDPAHSENDPIRTVPPEE